MNAYCRLLTSNLFKYFATLVLGTGLGYLSGRAFTHFPLLRVQLASPPDGLPALLGWMTGLIPGLAFAALLWLTNLEHAARRPRAENLLRFGGLVFVACLISFLAPKLVSVSADTLAAPYIGAVGLLLWISARLAGQRHVFRVAFGREFRGWVLALSSLLSAGLSLFLSMMAFRFHDVAPVPYLVAA